MLAPGQKEDFRMKAFLVATETINDETVFATYRKQVPATLEPFGGQFVTAAVASRYSKATGPIHDW
jgi:uncharacterized protein (DUF1330 family)